MAPLPVIADVYRLTLLWVHASGQRAVNVLHVHRTTSTAASVATLIDANVTANMWQPLSSGASVQELHVLKLDGTSSTYELLTSGAKWTGGTSGDFIPQAAVLISLKTGLRGPSNRGRIFLPFTTETSSGNGTLQTASQATMETAWSAFIAALGTGATTLVVASYAHAIFHNVDSFNVELPLATQRRRQDRVRF
jgi:hypothetical protein